MYANRLDSVNGRESENDIWFIFKSENNTACSFVNIRTSSVISVAMDLPISWYWGPLPRGPKRINKNLKATANIQCQIRYKMGFRGDEIWSNQPAETLWRWGLQPAHRVSLPGRGGQTPPLAYWETPALPPARCRPLLLSGSSSWNEGRSEREWKEQLRHPILLAYGLSSFDWEEAEKQKRIIHIGKCTL